MKKTLKILIFFVPLYCCSQVGINTYTPQGTLDVVGKMLLDSYLIDNVNSNVTGSNYFLMVKSNSSIPKGKVKLLDVSLRNVAPVNKYSVTISNVKEDEVKNLNTGMRASKYVVAISDAVFKLANSGKNTDTTLGSYSTEITTINVGAEQFYAVNLDFKGAETVSNQNGTWEISLVVYEKALVKDWGTFNGSVLATAVPVYSGVSTVTPTGLQD